MLARRDYSWAEKALTFWTTLTLLVLAVTSVALCYVTSPIACNLPAEATSSFIQYVLNVCYQKSKIKVVYREDQTVYKDTYHQWVPCYLGMAAIVCLVPHALWRTFSGFLWLDLDAFARTLSLNQERDPAGRHVMLRDSAHLLRAAFKGGNFVLTVATVIRKLLVVVVCLIQTILVFHVWQPKLERLQEDPVGWREISALPRSFPCEFDVAMTGRTLKYEVQCNLPVNLIFSKGFTFLFYLFFLLLLAATLDVIVTLFRGCLPVLRDFTIRRLLLVSADPSQDSQLPAVLPRFLESLGCDGRLLLAVTADCCGPLAASDLLQHLLHAFRAGASLDPGTFWKAEPVAPPSDGAKVVDNTAL